MKKLYLSGLLIIGMTLSLTGCGHEHAWVEATCTEARHCSECDKTEGEALEHSWVEATCTEARHCSECGETEGEALEHSWVEATCTEARHCSECGETEGEALAHSWIEADYQNPQTCSICGTTEGESLTAAFEEHGLTINTELGITYDYYTACYEDTSKETVAHATFLEYNVWEEDGLYGFDKEGYEWRSVTVSILFDDENAWEYGMMVGNCNENYYDIEDWDNSSYYDEENGFSYYTVNYNGEEYECAYYSYGGFDGWNNTTCSITYELVHLYYVPAGYDGIVVGLYDRKNTWEDGMYIYDIADENTLFFRLD